MKRMCSVQGTGRRVWAGYSRPRSLFLTYAGNSDTCTHHLWWLRPTGNRIHSTEQRSGTWLALNTSLSWSYCFYWAVEGQTLWVSGPGFQKGRLGDPPIHSCPGWSTWSHTLTGTVSQQGLLLQNRDTGTQTLRCEPVLVRPGGHPPASLGLWGMQPGPSPTHKTQTLTCELPPRQEAPAERLPVCQ